MSKTKAFAAFDRTSALGPWEVERREPTAKDVEFDILFCGVCHSDLHTARSEWPGTVYPVVPGHEIVGRVTRVGRDVKKFKVGDLAAVGCMVDSCKTCASCREGMEQYCDNNAIVFTYNSPDPHLSGKMTYGGYSGRIVVDERFCLHVPKNLDLAGAAPLLVCGDHALFASQALGREQGADGGDRRAGRAWAHGGEAVARAGGAHGAVHDVAGQGGGREAAWGGRGGGVEGRRRDEEAGGAV